MRTTRVLPVLCLGLSACQFPFGGSAAVRSFPPGVEVDANPPPPPAEPATMRTLEGIVSVTRPEPGAGARVNYAACADFDRLGVGRDHLYWRVFCERLPSMPPPVPPSRSPEHVVGDAAEAPSAGLVENLQRELVDARREAENNLAAMTEQLRRADRLAGKLETLRRGLSAQRTAKGAAVTEYVDGAELTGWWADPGAAAVLAGED